jgi:hypothetical protein
MGRSNTISWEGWRGEAWCLDRGLASDTPVAFIYWVFVLLFGYQVTGYAGLFPFFLGSTVFTLFLEFWDSIWLLYRAADVGCLYIAVVVLRVYLTVSLVFTELLPLKSIT